MLKWLLGGTLITLLLFATSLFFAAPEDMHVELRTVPLEGSESARSRVSLPAVHDDAARPMNVILFVADGFGFTHLTAAQAVFHGDGSAAVWDRFAQAGWHRPGPAEGFLVDSAASATALATGQPTANGAVGVDTEGRPLPNLFERAHTLGYRTGIVTDSYVWDATPAAFVAHVSDRDDASTILEQLAQSELEVLIGELEDLGEGSVPEWAPSIATLERRFHVEGPDPADLVTRASEVPDDEPFALIFEEDQVTNLDSSPALPELVEIALRRLGTGPRPFLLLVESEEPDSASHDQDTHRLLRGLQVIEQTLDVLVDFAEAHPETLLVFTSDHETGGLALVTDWRGNDRIQFRWATDGHTGSVVPVLARGPGAAWFSGPQATWEIGRRLGSMLRDESGR